MNRDQNVSVTLNEEEYKILNELMGQLNSRSYKKPSQAETIRHSVKFMRDYIDLPELVDDFKRELEVEKMKNELFKQSFVEFQSKVKL
ncbi:hypothetical protein [Anaerobacillus sp. 1_MG-2023]|uniref:hypothetical protein n=1 Tax=Anaerobacillus sp. 1_MG-2023 TaxID=3062655 RepID=UPI0026E1CA12|nr:hypothetical protein [Anaerobacillus sp. 1_MG-2023]MDO6658674.1 hypothetical protein [Anaerobacillus sp. 1_MG-2023]